MQNEPVSASPPPPFPTARVPWSPAEGLAFLLAFLAVQAACGFAIGLLGRGPHDLSLRLASADAAIMVIAWLFLKRRAGSAPQACEAIGLRGAAPMRALRRAAAPVAVGVAALVWWGVLQAVVLYHFRVPTRPQHQADVVAGLIRSGAWVEFGLLAFLAVIVAPLAEEVVFRGMAYLPLRARFGPRPAAIMVSLAFAGIHGYWPGLGHFFILALVFTWLVETTGTLWAPVAAHAAHNAFTIAILLMNALLQ